MDRLVRNPLALAVIVGFVLLLGIIFFTFGRNTDGGDAGPEAEVAETEQQAPEAAETEEETDPIPEPRFENADAIREFCLESDDCLVWGSYDPPDPTAYDLYPDDLERQRYHCQDEEVVKEIVLSSNFVPSVFCGSQAAYERWQEIEPLLLERSGLLLTPDEMVECQCTFIIPQADTLYYFVPD